jgi:predicted oxidoreductase
MKKVLLSDSGPETSDSIYSFWRWNNNEDLTIDKVKDIVAYTLELGINTFDVSALYGNGQIEELFGEALNLLQVKREDIVLFTKVGIKHPQSDGSIVYQELTEKGIHKQIEDSLKNLKTDYIDVVLVQDFDPLMKADIVASSLTSLQIRGKIKHIGIANFNVQQHKLFASRLSTEVVTNHFELNLLNTNALEDGRIDFIKEQYSKPMAFGPLADGRILYGQDKAAVAIRSVLEGLTSKYNSNIEQLAVAWIHKLGALPIIGSLNKDRIKNAATASDIKLSHEDWHRIYNATK